MSDNHLKPIHVLAAALLATLSTLAVGKELNGIASMDRGVGIRATPVEIAAGAKSWAFEVRLDTHSGQLDDDLTREAVLVDEAGRHHAPVAWEGSPPGGHHRQGVLRFLPVSPMPAAIELRIQRTGEPTPRSFKWQLR
ncbi:MAG: hypothetical protein ACM3PU_10415 [Gemmatimonadota bacterium]